MESQRKRIKLLLNEWSEILPIISAALACRGRGTRKRVKWYKCNKHLIQSGQSAAAAVKDMNTNLM